MTMVPKRTDFNLHKVVYCCRVIRNVRNSHVEGLTIFFRFDTLLTLTLNRKKQILNKVTKQPCFSDEASASRISFQSLVAISDVTSKVTAFRSGIMKRKLSREQI